MPVLKTKARHPLQPLIRDTDGRVCFKKNEIVRFLLDRGNFDMNDLASMNWTTEDREQFAQLIGYSLDGFAELYYVTNKTYEQAASQPVHKR